MGQRKRSEGSFIGRDPLIDISLHNNSYRVGVEGKLTLGLLVQSTTHHKLQYVPSFNACCVGYCVVLSTG